MTLHYNIFFIYETIVLDLQTRMTMAKIRRHASFVKMMIMKINHGILPIDTMKKIRSCCQAIIFQAVFRQRCYSCWYSQYQICKSPHAMARICSPTLFYWPPSKFLPRPSAQVLVERVSPKKNNAFLTFSRN